MSQRSRLFFGLYPGVDSTVTWRTNRLARVFYARVILRCLFFGPKQLFHREARRGNRFLLVVGEVRSVRRFPLLHCVREGVVWVRLRMLYGGLWGEVRELNGFGSRVF